jgi:excisionase family DNA binding protein
MFTTEQEPRWLSYREAAEYTGLSEATLRRLLRAGRLTPFRPAVGRRLIRLDRREIDGLMLASRAKED